MFNRYESILHPSAAYYDAIDGEFTSYQALPDAFGEGKTTTQVWDTLSKVKLAESAMYKKLCAVAFIVLSIPHSNAGEERLFSQCRKNLTEERSLLDMKTTLNSIMILKNSDLEPCHSIPIPAAMRKMAKSATAAYNQLHRKKT